MIEYIESRLYNLPHSFPDIWEHLKKVSTILKIFSPFVHVFISLKNKNWLIMVSACTKQTNTVNYLLPFALVVSSLSNAEGQYHISAIWSWTLANVSQIWSATKLLSIGRYLISFLRFLSQDYSHHFDASWFTRFFSDRVWFHLPTQNVQYFKSPLTNFIFICEMCCLAVAVFEESLNNIIN